MESPEGYVAVTCPACGCNYQTLASSRKGRCTKQQDHRSIPVVLLPTREERLARMS
jgi:hypothetical protein